MYSGGGFDFSVRPSPIWTLIFDFFEFIEIRLGSRGTGLGTVA